MGKCEALTAQGRTCGNGRKYGRLCGTHYAMAERDVNRVTTGEVNGRTIAIARYLDRVGISPELPSGQVRSILRDLHIMESEGHIRDAIAYRRSLMPE
jgi:hypothetical protein